MPKPWNAVEQSSEYQSLSPRQQQEAKHQYFNQVVAQKTEYKSLSPEQKQQASREFFGVVDNKRHYKASEVPGAALNNLVPSARNFVGGMIEAGKGVGKAALHAVRNPADTASYLFNAKDPRMVNDVVRTAKGIGGFYAERYGSKDAIKRTMAEDPVGVIADISSLMTGGAGAAKKVLNPASIAGKLAKGAGKVSEAINPTRVVAPFIEVPVKVAVKKGATLVHNVKKPKLTAYRVITEGKGAQVAEAIENPVNKLIPGGKPTVADLTADLNTTKLTATTKQAQGLLSSENMTRRQAHNAARLKQVQDVGKTPVISKAAGELRETDMGPLYDEVKRQVVPVDKELAEILDTPHGREAVKAAKTIAADKRITFQKGGNPAETVNSTILDKHGNPIQHDVPAEPLQYKGTSIQNIKMALDKMISKPESFSIDAASVDGIRDVRHDFVNWANTKVKGFNEAREGYAEMSKPIDEMLIGQQLEEELLPILNDTNSTDRGKNFVKAMKNSPKTIEKATEGRSFYKDISEAVSPENMEKLNSVVDDLSRSDLVRQQAIEGAKSAPDLKNIATDTVISGNIPPLFHPVITIAREIVKRMGGDLNEKVAMQLAKELVLNPDEAAVSIRQMLARDARFNRKMGTAAKVGKAASKVIRTPAIYNSLSPNAQNNNALIER